MAGVPLCNDFGVPVEIWPPWSISATDRLPFIEPTIPEWTEQSKTIFKPLAYHFSESLPALGSTSTVMLEGSLAER